MKHLCDKIQLAMRKCRTHGTIFNALMLKDKDTMQYFIQKDIGYKFMKTLCSSPPYFKKASKDLMCLIRFLGPATFFCSFLAAETK